jgi:predicted RNA binding protein YcfA (HicA-like mRNA interferase family)
MPPLGPIKRQELIRALRKLGFDGPYAGGHHEYMLKGSLKLFVPNPHRGDISASLLLKILRQAGIDQEEWTALT